MVVNTNERNIPTRCKFCDEFVKTLKPRKLMFTREMIIARKRVNHNHPLANQEIVKRTIRKTRLSGKYTDEADIVRTLGSIRTEFEKELYAELNSHSRVELLVEALFGLDELNLNRVDQIVVGANSTKNPDYQAMRNLSENDYFGKVSKALERIIEFTLSSIDFSEKNRGIVQSLYWLTEMTTELAMINNVIEDTLGLWHRGKLIITNNGWERELFPEDESTFKRMYLNWSRDDVFQTKKHFANIGSSEGNPTNEVLELLDQIEAGKLTDGAANGDELDLIQEINPIYEKVFGYKLTSKLKGLIGILDFPFEARRLWFCEDELVAYYRSTYNWSSETAIKILNSLSLDGQTIRNENAEPFEFKRLSRVSRRPLPRIKFKEKNIYFLSEPIMTRCLENIVYEYSSKTHPEIFGTPVYDVTSKVLNKHGDWFTRERIYPIFREAKLPVHCCVKKIGKINVESECGEIDILSYSPSQNALLVVECKHKALKQVNINQFQNTVSDYTEPKGFVTTLTKKVNWISAHSNEVIEYLGIKPQSNFISPIGIFVTNYHCPASEFVKGILFLTEQHLGEWCNKQVASSTNTAKAGESPIQPI